VQASQVQNFFHSVQLNVNNPHFLIMQGRITKVLNMKPPEILGLIEEAAGTRMYEAKKVAAQKTIEKKQEKVVEITAVLRDDITPTLDKLRSDRQQYLQWAANNTRCEQLTRLCVAYDFKTQDDLRANGQGKLTALEAAAKDQAARASEMRGAAAAKGREIDAQAAKVAASRGPEFARLVERDAAASTELVKATSVLQVKQHGVADADKARAALAKQERDGDAAIASLAAAAAKQRAEGAAAAELAKKLSADVSAAQAHVMKVAAGLAAAESEGADAAAGGTLADALMGAKGKATALEAEATQRELKAKHLRAKGKDLAAAVKEAEKDAKTLQGGMDKAQKLLETRRAAVAALSFDAKGEEQLRAQRETSAAAAAALGEQYEAEAAGLSALVDFTYDRAGMGAGWDDARVKGTVASLVRVRRPDAASALEVCAGGKLYQVIVDTEVTGKALLEMGRLKRRVTILPLNQIKGRTLAPQQVAAADAIAKGAAVPAISLVGYPAELARAMEYAFGDTFICNNPEVAKAVCFDPKVRAPCVTLAGDVFDPAGTLEGGSPPSANGEPLLLRLQRLSELAERLAAARAALKAAETALAGMAKAGKEYAKLHEEMELAQHDVALLKQRFDASSLGQTQARLADATKELEAEEAGIAAARAGAKEAAARAKALETEMKTASSAREAKVAALEADLGRLKKEAAAADAKAKKLTQAADVTACELEQAQKERAGLAAAVAAAEAAVAAAKAEVAAAQATVAAAEGKAAEAKAALDAAKEAAAAADSAHRALLKERQAALDGAERLERGAKEADKELGAAREAVGQAAKAVLDLLAKHPWIHNERQYFGQSHTDYDFNRQNPKTAQAELRSLEKTQAELSRKINKKVLGMIETAEREYNDLRNKKTIIETDKMKIEVRL
jgi:structural maintenance of chromosome 2